MPIGGDVYMLNCRARVVWLCLLLGVYWDAPTASLAQAVPGLDEQRTLAERGDADAQFNLGLSYDNGEGVPQDYTLAHMWYNLSASKSSGEIKGFAVKARDLLAKTMTPEDLSEAQRLASEWKPKE